MEKENFTYFKKRRELISETIDTILLLETAKDPYTIGDLQTHIIELMKELRSLDEAHNVFIKEYVFIGIGV